MQKIPNHKFIILDRDGVINFDSDKYIKSPDEWRAIPGSLEAMAQLNQAGFNIIVISNQSGIGRGFYTLKDFEATNQKMMRELKEVGGEIKKIYFCPHVAEDHCDCRKPKPGMLLQAVKEFGFDLKETFFIGDKQSDYLAAKTAGCDFILVKTGYGKEMLQKHSEIKKQAMVAKDLQEAVRIVIQKST